jgi:hypothetical protein
MPCESGNHVVASSNQAARGAATLFWLQAPCEALLSFQIMQPAHTAPSSLGWPAELTPRQLRASTQQAREQSGVAQRCAACSQPDATQHTEGYLEGLQPCTMATMCKVRCAIHQAAILSVHRAWLYNQQPKPLSIPCHMTATSPALSSL